MSATLSTWFMIGLDCLMIIYTLWVLSLSQKGKFHYAIGIALFTWLTLLHLGLSSKIIFPEDISGIAFLCIIFTAVGFVGLILLTIPSIKSLLLSLTQEQLLLAQEEFGSRIWVRLS